MVTESTNFSLKHFNTFGINVFASRFIEYDTLDDLRMLISEQRITNPFLHIGGGSNLLFLSNFIGTVLHSKIKTIELVDETADAVFVKVGSGVIWDDFVACCVQNNWYGAENLSIIPGEVGAVAVQNIGAYGVEAKDLITHVHTINMEGKEQVYSNNMCDFAYRNSIFKKPAYEGVIITNVTFRLSKLETYTLDYGTVRQELEGCPEITLSRVRDVIVRVRQNKLPDPAVLGNAGSFFMNPVVPKVLFETLQLKHPSIPFYPVDEDHVKIPAGWLIEQSGMKGMSIGPAAVYHKQALVLVNKGGASGHDILRLSDAVRTIVKETFGIDIQPEVKIIGR